MHPENDNFTAEATGVLFAIAFLNLITNILWSIPLALFGIEPLMREAFGVDLSFPAVWFSLLTLFTILGYFRRGSYPHVSK